MRHSRLPILVAPVILSFVFAGTVTVFAQQAKPVAKAEERVAQFAQYSLKGYGRTTLILSKKNATTFEAVGIEGKPIVATSTRGYEITAPKFELLLKKAEARSAQKVTEMKATGGVKIVVREAEANRVTTLTSDRAIYSATLDPKDRGKIDLFGNVESVTKDLASGESWKQASERGTITLVDADTTKIELFNGSIEAEMNEPVSNSKKKNP